MSTNYLIERNPFDILVKNFFQEAGTFSPLTSKNIPHPLDIYETDDGLFLDIACTGIDKKEIEIQIQDNVIRVNYEKSEDEHKNTYIHRGLAKRSFNLGWKIDRRYELAKAKAEFKDGLLKISIPTADNTEPESRTLLIT